MITDSCIRLEECARRILQREMGRPVVRNDDGSRPGLYDLRSGDEDPPDIAIECVGAVDRVRTETWNIGPARGPLSLNVGGDWHVVLKPHARVNPIRRQIESVLQACEDAGLRDFMSVGWCPSRREPSIFKVLNALSIESIHCYNVTGTGLVHLGMTGIGGSVDPTGRDLPGWIGSFLRSSARVDVLQKLQKSRAAQCHAFISVSFGGVPWSVESYLGTRTNILPADAPDLPAPVNYAWVMYGARGVRWDGAVWRFFNATVPAQ